MSDSHILVTDRYDRGYFASLGPRVVIDSSIESPEMQAGLTAAFSRANGGHPDLADVNFDFRFDAFGAGHGVTRVAHMDPIMALVSRPAETGFSMDVPVGKATLSMAHLTTTEGNALSLGAGHGITVFLRRAQETDSFLGARAYRAFAGLNSETVYGRAQADIIFGKRVTLNGSVTAGRTSFCGNGLITDGRMNARAVALGLIPTSA